MANIELRKVKLGEGRAAGEHVRRGLKLGGVEAGEVNRGKVGATKEHAAHARGRDAILDDGTRDGASVVVPAEGIAKVGDFVIVRKHAALAIDGRDAKLAVIGDGPQAGAADAGGNIALGRDDLEGADERAIIHADAIDGQMRRTRIYVGIKNKLVIGVFRKRLVAKGNDHVGRDRRTGKGLFAHTR